ncbi:MAG TPA: hypothetical protein VGG90_05035 [Candidatus Dormibacteraeota bacterium]|jgi:hypothetical protein
MPRPVLRGVVVGGLTLAFLVARLVGWSKGGHQPGQLELFLQVLVLLGAFYLVASRVTRKR